MRNVLVLNYMTKWPGINIHLYRQHVYHSVRMMGSHGWLFCTSVRIFHIVSLCLCHRHLFRVNDKDAPHHWAFVRETTVYAWVSKGSVLQKVFSWHGVTPLWRKTITWPVNSIMTSLNGNIFHFTGRLCGEFTGHRWIRHTKASDAEFWWFLWSAPE